MIVTVNGSDLETLGYSLTSIEGWNADVSKEFVSTAMPGLVGHIVNSSPTSAPRTIRIGVLASGGSLALLDVEINKLVALFTGTVTLVFGDSPDKSIDGVLTNVRSELVDEKVGFNIYSRQLTLEVTCHDPAKYDTSTATVTCTATAVACPVGTLAHGGIFRITGCTNPTVTYKDYAGTTQATMTFACTLTTTDYLELDLDNITVQKSIGGVTSSALDYWTAGDFWWIEPLHAVYASSSWPTLQVSSGTGVLTYQRRWAN